MDSPGERERVGRQAVHRGRGGGGRGKGHMRERSPGQTREMSRIKRRLEGEGEDLGTNLGTIRMVIKKGMDAVVGNVPREMLAGTKEEIGVMVKAVEEVMEKISEKDKRERVERQERERRMEEKLEQLEGKLRALEEKAEMSSSRLENRVKLLEEMQVGGMEKVRDIEEQVEGVKEHVELVSGCTLKLKIAESVKQMEEKVKEAGRALKVVNLDLGLETESKALIVRRVLREVRRKARQEDAHQVDRVLRRTRVVVLGRRTEGRKVGERTIWTVPILLQCIDKTDAKDLEWGLRGSGVSLTVHWPEEVMDFIKSIKREEREGSPGQVSWIRVRPVEVEGQVRIRMDTKISGVGRFRMRGEWACPPLNNCLWKDVKGLYDPISW